MPLPDGSILLDDLELQADDLAASGQLELAGNAALRRLDLGHLAIGRSDLSLSLRPRAPAGVTVAVEGRRLDFSPYLGDLVEGGEGTLPPLAVLAPRRRAADRRGRGPAAARAGAAPMTASAGSMSPSAAASERRARP